MNKSEFEGQTTENTTSLELKSLLSEAFEQKKAAQDAAKEQTSDAKPMTPAQIQAAAMENIESEADKAASAIKKSAEEEAAKAKEEAERAEAIRAAKAKEEAERAAAIKAAKEEAERAEAARAAKAKEEAERAARAKAAAAAAAKRNAEMPDLKFGVRNDGRSPSVKRTPPAAKKQAVPPKKQGWSKKKKTGVVLGILFLVVCILAGVVVWLFFHYTGLLKKEDVKPNMEKAPINSSELVDESDTFDAKAKDEELKEQLKKNSKKISNENVMNILLVGEDLRDTDSSSRGNTDVMMVVSLNQEQETITLTSLMRDMYVYMPDFNDSGRLNSAYWHGGSEYLEKVIEDYFGMEIDRYVKVNFMQFIDVVEAVGGLDLEVAYNEAEAMQAPLDEQNHYLGYDYGTDYIDLAQYGSDVPAWGYTYGVDENIPTLKMHLNGNQALAYARIRHNCGDDYGRTQRQRIVIQEIIKKSKSMSLVDLDALINKVFPEVNTDITSGEIASLLLNAFDYMEYDVQQLRIPVDNYYSFDFINSMEVLSPDFQANAAIMKYVIYGEQTNAEDAAAQYQQEIYDGTFWEKNGLEYGGYNTYDPNYNGGGYGYDTGYNNGYY